MTSGQDIDYEALAQDAMRTVVRSVLTRVAKTGLPGEHHFYIAFNTQAPGVSISKRLKEKYPEEMTIVLQHRFWDLSVESDGFEVKLTFDGIPERLVVPFAAIRVFFDPSVRYGLQFEDPDVEPEAGDDMSQRFGARGGERTNGTRATTLRSTAPKKPKVPRKAKEPKPEKTEKGATPTPVADKAPVATGPRLAAVPSKPADEKTKRGEAKQPDKPAEQRPRQDNGGAQILSLDAFRKK
jgi:hypothetical protein